jgi:hypothetical protein
MTALQRQREIERGEKYAEAARKQLALDREKLAKIQAQRTTIAPATR